MPNATTIDLNAWLLLAQMAVDGDYNKTSNSFEHAVVSPVLSFGKITKKTKYVRIITTDRWNHQSVWGFIRLEDGSVLKADGWKTPALNFARGNIFDKAHGLERARWTGIS